jgi:outer membrane biosynthesis protein TonB
MKKRQVAPRRRPAGIAGTARRAKPAQPQVHHYDKLVDEGDDEGFFGKHRTKIVIGVVALLGAGLAYVLHSAKPSSAPSKAPERVMMITLPPPPPPPPPPPVKRPPPPPKEEKMQEAAPAEKKDEAPKPVAPPKEALGTGVKGNGPGLSGLGNTGNGGGFGGPRGGNGSKWGDFAYKVQNKVASALRSNDRTKKAELKLQVRIWSDPSGHIYRCKLDTKTGDHNLDETVQNVLNNIQLDEPPPTGMPMPIVMRLTAVRRP